MEIECNVKAFYWINQIPEYFWCIYSESLDGIIHLDIKMENFVCMPKGSDEKCEEVKLVDFGSAIREEKAGKEQQNCEKMHSGTPEFMSPEQLGRCGKASFGGKHFWKPSYT